MMVWLLRSAVEEQNDDLYVMKEKATYRWI